jgi:aspartyl-tRNA(Asn)/glutamyl-tRNA(Gln) amidotransferase subunit C
VACRQHCRPKKGCLPKKVAFRKSLAQHRMSLTRQEVEKVSLLARLRLTSEELDRMTVQMGQIVAYVESLSELDTESVEPMAHALDVSNVFAADELRPSLPRDEALANAPHHDREFYLVPAVLGE